MTAVLYAPTSTTARRVAGDGHLTGFRPGPSHRIVGAVVAALLVVAACVAGIAMNARHAGASTINAVLQNYAFSPASLTVNVGDTVTWTNLDDAPHTVTTLSGPTTISSPTLNKGDKFSYKFTVPGTYKIYCAVHPNMTQTVTVVSSGAAPSSTPPTSTAPSASSGSPGSGSSGSSGSMPGMSSGSSGSGSSGSGSTPAGSSPAGSSPAGSSSHPGSSAPASGSACSNTMLVNAFLNPFIVHLDKAHLEESPGQQVSSLLNVDSYAQLHTVMLEDMVMPLITAIQNSLTGVDPLITHIDKAHLEESPGQQVSALLNVDSYAQLHTVMIEDMLNPLTGSVTGTYGC